MIFNLFDFAIIAYVMYKNSHYVFHPNSNIKRFRALPSYFSEMQIIGYATFISSLTISSTFPVYYCRKEELLSNLIMISVMYGFKLYIIYFLPEKNTKEHFRAIMKNHSMTEVDKQVKKYENEICNL